MPRAAHLFDMRKRRAETVPPSPSVNLPIAMIWVDPPGVMRVVYDGNEFPPPTLETGWTRARFGDLLDALSAHRSRSIRVEIHEHDGSVFTDIVHATRREPSTAEASRASSIPRARHEPPHQLTEVHGSGFIPGEDVTVALTLSTVEGAADGTTRAILDLQQFVTTRAEILFVGRVSGVIAVDQLPS